jgi:RNA polymerase sigma-70 factor (ECF subfamily)
MMGTIEEAAVNSSQDKNLSQRLRTGDENALTELFELYRERLRTMVLLRLDTRLNGRISGSDILQEVYIDALKRVEHFKQQPDMPGYLWLRLLASQRLVDIHRQHLGAEMRTVVREIALVNNDYRAASSVCIARQFAASQDSPSQAAVKHENSKILEHALEGMDPLDREVLALRHFEELSNDEVADILGLKKSAASNRYVRALLRLKTILGKAGLESKE